MAVVQNLYKIFKLPASFLVANNCNIPSYTLSQGQKEDNIVSIGDNLVFQQLRYLHGDFRHHRQLFNTVVKYRSRMKEYKKLGQYDEARVLDTYITEILFVKDIVNVYVDGKKSDFNLFRTNGFYLNGIHYVYLCSGSGQIRRNTATFINEEYHDRLVKTLNCGLDEKTSEFVLAKYSAYFALSFSSILWVRTPRVCVIKDFYRTLPQQPVDFIEKDAEGKASVVKKTMDIELNCADGQGLIDPKFAQLWGKDMDLDFTPCSFVVRSCFIKGNLATFDFREYAHQHGISTIRDKWGVEYNIDDIDVLISESQFKTHKYYNSWQEYCSYMEKGKIHWGVARYNKKEDDEYVLANYQYIQALTLSKEDISKLIQPTVDWIQKICSGDLLPTLLYSFGIKDDTTEYDQMMSVAQTTAMKAVVKNNDFLKDSYIQYKIYKNITESVNQAKLGKIWLKGNYQFMISDPMAQCQSALGLEPTGLLKADEVYSNFWRIRALQIEPNRTEDYIVDTCRSPMIDLHEHNPMNVILNNTEADFWYQYLPSGIIYNTYDTSCFRHSDADYDGDIVMSTDNEYFIKGSNKNHNIITYEKGLAKTEKINTANITKTVLKGFGTGVGGFSNTATILYAMAAMFDKPGHEDQYKEIMTRIKLLREIVGQEIDRIKGADKPFLPSDWKKYEIVEPDDPQDVKIQKMRKNALVISKKPYFFRYLYPELNQKFKQFEASYNQISRDMFGIKLKKLLKKENQTEEEKMLIKRYQKYSPFIVSNCTMNVLCKQFEAIDFDIKFAKDVQTNSKKAPVSMLPTFEKEYDPIFNPVRLAAVKKMYSTYSTKKQIKFLNELYKDDSDPDYREIRSSIYDSLIQDLQSTLVELKMCGEEFLYYCYKLSQTNKNFNWGFAWEIIGEEILAIIPQGTTYAPVETTKDHPDAYEYLGKYYVLNNVSDSLALCADKIIEIIFGINDEDSQILEQKEVEDNYER